MRTTGLAESTKGLVRHDHACWAFGSRDEWCAQASAFLADGLSQGHALVYAGASAPEQLQSELSLPDVAGLFRKGGLRVLSTDDAYGPTADNAEAQVAAFETMAVEALRAGFTGLRVAADVTALAAGDRIDDYGTYERLVDSAIARSPLTGLCGFDAQLLPAETIERLAALHPVGSPASFRFFTSGEDTALLGEVDVFVAEAFEWALSATSSRGYVIDASDATFLNHHALAAIDRVAEQRESVTEVVTNSHTVASIAELLDLSHVTVHVSA